MFYIISLLKSLIFFTGSYSVNVFPSPLEKDEEEKLINQMLMGDTDARGKLIEHNLRLVAHIVKKYEGKEYDSDRQRKKIGKKEKYWYYWSGKRNRLI